MGVVKLSNDFTLVDYMMVAEGISDMLFENDWRYFTSHMEGVDYRDMRKEGKINSYLFGECKYGEGITSMGID